MSSSDVLTWAVFAFAGWLWLPGGLERVVLLHERVGVEVCHSTGMLVRDPSVVHDPDMQTWLPLRVRCLVGVDPLLHDFPTLQKEGEVPLVLVPGEDHALLALNPEAGRPIVTQLPQSTGRWGALDLYGLVDLVDQDDPCWSSDLLQLTREHAAFYVDHSDPVIDPPLFADQIALFYN